MTKVYNKLQQSTNDIPFLRVIKQLRKGIEQHTSPEKPLQKYIDSEIMHDYNIDTINNDHINKSSYDSSHQPPYTHTSTGEYDDDHITDSSTHSHHQYHEEDWIRTTTGKWTPPPESTSHSIPTINKSNQAAPAQNDSGANRIVTDNIHYLLNMKLIDPLPMGGCNKHDEAAIVCTAVGDMLFQTTDGETVKFKAYYSADVDGTIISPTAMVQQRINDFHGWVKYANCDSNKGTLKLLGRNDTSTKIFHIYCANDLWYHHHDSILDNHNSDAKIRPLSVAAKYELWHQRTAHAGFNTLEHLHKHVTGVPPLKGNAFYRCPSCMSGKLVRVNDILVNPRHRKVHNVRLQQLRLLPHLAPYLLSCLMTSLPLLKNPCLRDNIFPWILVLCVAHLTI